MLRTTKRIQGYISHTNSLYLQIQMSRSTYVLWPLSLVIIFISRDEANYEEAKEEKL